MPSLRFLRSDPMLDFWMALIGWIINSARQSPQELDDMLTKDGWVIMDADSRAVHYERSLHG